MAWDTTREKFYRINKIVTNGAYGEETTYSIGAEFYAVCNYQSSTTARVAEKEHLIGNWVVTTYKNIVLDRNDIIMRARDNLYLKIDTPTRNVSTPSHASFEFHQATAYEFSLAKGEAYD